MKRLKSMNTEFSNLTLEQLKTKPMLSLEITLELFKTQKQMIFENYISFELTLIQILTSNNNDEIW
jgi:hypothetical protein